MRLHARGRNIRIKRAKAQGEKGFVPLLILSPKNRDKNAPGLLWLHGGGYMLGMKEMVYISRAYELVEKFGAVVVSPGYRLAFQKPYPAAIQDCYTALEYLKNHAEDLGVNPAQLMVGGESAGGGLAAALCMLARDRGEICIAYQMPLYPMLDNFDTESSKNNRGKVWNTRRNHLGWRMYLRENALKNVSPYASPARQTDYRDLPPCYTFVGSGEPFYTETLRYVENLRLAGVTAEADVYPSDIHAFDMLRPDMEISRLAAEKFREKFAFALEHFFAPQP